MSLVVNAVNSFNEHFKRIVQYINETDIEGDNNMPYTDTPEYASLSKKQQEILKAGEKVDEPLSFKEQVELDNYKEEGKQKNAGNKAKQKVNWRKKQKKLMRKLEIRKETKSKIIRKRNN